MKLVFAHDHIFYQYNNQYFSTGGLSKEMLERYTDVFEEVVVISRQRKIIKFDDNLTLASTQGVKFVEIPNFKKLNGSHERIKAKKIINNVIETCDALIARLPSSIGSIATSSAQKLNKPYLIEMVACPWDALWNHSIKGKIVAPLTYFSTKSKVSEASYVLYVTNEFLQKRYPTKGKSVNCSNVALTAFEDNVLKRRLEKINNLEKSGKVIIGTTGAVNVRHKGQQYIIEAIGDLKKRGNTNVEYQLVGAGGQSYLKSVAKKYNVVDQVKFLGPIQHNKVFDWLETIDLYAQPSRQEGLPRALIEAMSRGVPAFGAKTAGIPELLEEEFIFSNTNSNVFEICSILSSLSREKMILQARRNFDEAKKYDKNTISKRRINFFEHFKKDAMEK